MASRGVNKVILVGRVGQDPEIKYLPSGGAVASLSIATSEAWKDKTTGEQKDRTEWHRCVAYQRLAEIIGEYVQKGAQLYVEGSLRTRSWEQEGVKRYATEIILNELQMLGDRPKAAATAQPAGTSAAHYKAGRDGESRSAPPQAEPIDNFDDDIPF